jgi:hypothetical protein
MTEDEFLDKICDAIWSGAWVAVLVTLATAGVLSIS